MEFHWLASFRSPSLKCAMWASLPESSAIDVLEFSRHDISRYEPLKSLVVTHDPDELVAYFRRMLEESQYEMWATPLDSTAIEVSNPRSSDELSMVLVAQDPSSLFASFNSPLVSS